VKSGLFTKSDYARRLGIRPSQVSNYIARQQLTPPALRPDGTIDAALADTQLRVTVDPVRQASRPGRAARASAADVTTAPATAPIDFQASSVLLRSRALMAQITAERTRREFQAERGRYTLTATAEAETRRILTEPISAIDQAIPDLVDALGGGRGNLVTIRKWWYQLRAKEAARHHQIAATLPEFVADEAVI
jgi:hypothetical protein